MWSRVLGALLIVAAALLSLDGLAWLFSPDQTIGSVLAARLLLAGRIVLTVIGVVCLVLPGIPERMAPMKSLLLGSAATLLLIGLVGTLGVLLRPPIDYLVPTRPVFTCNPSDAFCERSAEAGLADVLRYGKGAAFVDMDGDGWVDLFAADAERRLRDDWGISSFYLNNGDGSFRSVDLGISQDDLLSSWNASFADADNDGDQDVVIASGGYAGYSSLSFYENSSGEQADQLFVSATDKAGFTPLNNKPHRWWGIGWADYDNDGLLDLAISRVYGPVHLFRNLGDNKFADVTREMGITTPRPWFRDGKNVVWFDYDNDGDQDLYYAGIETHMFYENEGGKSFVDVTDKVFAGVFPENVYYEEDFPVVFSAAAADFDQDGDEDLYLGRQMEQDLVLFNDGQGNFVSAGRSAGIDVNISLKGDRDIDFENTMGLGVGDLFDDGWPDVIVGSGDPKRADKDVIYCNTGGQFERCTEVLRGNGDGPYRTRTHGVVFADVNQDGATDVFQSLGGDNWWDRKLDIDSREYGALFVRNPDKNHNTATLMLEGTKSNRDAIGARIRVDADETHYYTVRSMQAFQSQNQKPVIIRLGSSATANVQIQWPSGLQSELQVKSGDRVVVREGQ